MSEYNMSHTGQELDDAINRVQSGYVMPTGTLDITENGSHDVKQYANVNVNVSAGTGTSDIEWVTCNLDLQTFQISNVSHTLAQVIEAANAGKLVKLKISYPGFLSSTATETALADLSVYNALHAEFSATLNADFGLGTNLYHFVVAFNNDYTVGLGVSIINTMTM